MFCSECGGSYAVEDLVRFGSSFVCVNCKPAYVQRLREGGQPAGTTLAGARYAGFWIRAVALFLDGLIVGAVTVPVFLLVGLSVGGLRTMDPAQPPPVALFGLVYLVILVLATAYHVWFISQKGATPGKMVVGLKVVTTSGQNLTYARALGRYFAVMLSAFTFYIGFIIAAFDSEKRALHDHICATRVIRK